MEAELVIIGAGLAGSEAAWQAVNRGVRVKLYEMRPRKMAPAHTTAYFAELVCSNSLRAAGMENAVGLLKEEMRIMNSLIMKCADANRVPAGGALAVDRQKFAAQVTAELENHPLVEIVREEVTSVPNDGPAIIATGPLTSEAMAASIKELTGEDYLYFYDAAAPIVTYESLNHDVIYRASRYGKGDADYLNCPMTKEQYESFWHELTSAETVPLKTFEKEIFFEGCMPIEAMAARGMKTLLFGPMKPVGLENPKTGERPYAVVQLRQDDMEGTLYNIVGFQTHLKWGEQQRVFRMIPGLEKAEFVRYGVMHRNTFINSPTVLEPTFQFRKRKDLFFAGQITGVEGYVESAAAGLMAGINAARLVKGQEPVVFPPATAHGALSHYITTANPASFQPMNINFGLLPPLEERIKDKKMKNRLISERAVITLENFKNNL
ncbi:methylenetetrahydrofolate--tRNA-(uracil(54)-C(5))-methyltransferase (FADH(2)-oxidizing) TrmFO [Thermincola potens]|uniref:Methylenetetrahydrofolate--tRNA-(uracil-5-)-methyltransferase TrmFO n=1 Tax=Thermincola potens (strain JR) TaxID=635013 RepID=D5XFI2_THEPJ|nr:methylenetetrahydrofolate--tRNA-(uracil(54)-C(5))-methyltransferase (FADH(2)-oxidizing) TrmFO [Thermincola potens]ADG82403.1 gid protein [Thermincola potens JR]